MPATNRATFSVLVTNSRNGGQHEILVTGQASDDAYTWIAANRPHYIVKRIDRLPHPTAPRSMSYLDYAQVAWCAYTRARAVTAASPHAMTNPDRETAEAMLDLAWSHWKRAGTAQ